MHGYYSCTHLYNIVTRRVLTTCSHSDVPSFTNGDHPCAHRCITTKHPQVHTSVRARVSYAATRSRTGILCTMPPPVRTRVSYGAIHRAAAEPMARQIASVNSQGSSTDSASLALQ